MPIRNTVRVPKRRQRELTFDLIYTYLHDLLNWIIKYDFTAEDIRYFRRTIAMVRIMINMTGQDETKPKFDNMWRRISALEKHYKIYD